MPPKQRNTDIELKVRIPRGLMEKLNDYWHQRKLPSRKHAVIELFDSHPELCKMTNGEIQSEDLPEAELAEGVKGEQNA